MENSWLKRTIKITWRTSHRPHSLPLHYMIPVKPTWGHYFLAENLWTMLNTPQSPLLETLLTCLWLLAPLSFLVLLLQLHLRSLSWAMLHLLSLFNSRVWILVCAFPHDAISLDISSMHHHSPQYHQGMALPHPVLHHGPDLQISTPSGLPNSLLNSSTWMIHRHQTDLILHTTHHPWYLHPSSYPNQLFQTPPPCQIQTPHPINFTSSVTWPLLNQIQALNNCYITWSHRFPIHLPMVTISIHYPLPLKLPSMLKLEVSADLISSFLHQDLQQFLTTEDQILASPPPLPVLPFKLFPAFLCSSFWMYQKYLWNVSSSS